MDRLFRLPSAIAHDPRVDAWFHDAAVPLRWITRPWFAQMRAMGPDLRETLHDGCPVACCGNLAFGYVNAFRAHAAVGFFRGAALPDPAGILEGTGHQMRHVKLRPDQPADAAALAELIRAAWLEAAGWRDRR